MEKFKAFARSLNEFAGLIAISIAVGAILLQVYRPQLQPVGPVDPPPPRVETIAELVKKFRATESEAWAKVFEETAAAIDATQIKTDAELSTALRPIKELSLEARKSLNEAIERRLPRNESGQLTEGASQFCRDFARAFRGDQ